jgi:IclR family transcriptional regulator, acetate operon repressor
MRRRVDSNSEEGVGVISKVFKILEAIQGSPSGLTLKPLCEVTGIHKSTAHRFLKHLERERYVLRTESGTYMIGPRFSQMNGHANPWSTLQTVARPVLWELWKSTNETVNLGTLDQGTLLYIDVIESAHEFRLASRVGTRRSLHATALGKALTALLPEAEREAVLARVQFQPLTPKTIMNLVQFRQELETVRKQGYALDDEETTLGARCVSAPILSATREVVAAISVSGPVARITSTHVPAIARAVMSAARAISAGLGFSSSEQRDKTTLDRPSTLL